MSWFDFGGDYGFDAGADVGYVAPEVPDYGGFGAFEMPDWSGYDFGEAMPQAQDLSAYQWDTTTGQLVSPGGTPELGVGAYDAAEGGGGGAGYGTDQEIAALRDQGLAYQGGEQPFTPNQEPSWLDRISGGTGTLNRLLGTNLGRTAGALGVGALGLGVQQLIAGRLPSFRPPTYTPGPVARAGEAAWLAAMGGGGTESLQRAIQSGIAGQAGVGQQLVGRVAREAAAEEAGAPYEAAIRGAAYPQVAGLMTPGQEQTLPDPVQAALREELLGVLSGGATGVSPVTGRRQQQEEQETRARLFRQLGQDYELTTPGIQAIQEMQRRHNSERYTERLATIASLEAPERGRYQFGVTTPTSLYGQRENIRRNNLQDAAGLTQFGVRGVPQNLQSLSQLAPINRLMGEPEQA